MNVKLAKIEQTQSNVKAERNRTELCFILYVVFLVALLSSV